jgi:NifB/MoaA-like Fe-S oxidoreductase
MHTQIVLARKVNDGKELDYTARELFKMYPYVQTVAVVPVGMTKFRQGLTEIEDINENYAKQVIEQIRSLNEEFKVDFIQPADEFYFRAGIEVEKHEFYGNFAQIENGVGTTAKFEREIDESLTGIEKRKFDKSMLLISGTSACKFIEKQAEKIKNRLKGLKIDVLAVKNEFFGESVNCTGLLTGKDIISSVNNLSAEYDYLVMPCHVLRENTEVFLDGTTVDDVEKATGKKVRITDGSGESFVNALTLENYGE